MPVDAAARESVEAFRRRQYLYVPGTSNRIGSAFMRFLPQRFLTGPRGGHVSQVPAGAGKRKALRIAVPRPRLDSSFPEDTKPRKPAVRISRATFWRVGYGNKAMTKRIKQTSRRAFMKASLLVSGAVTLAGASISWLVAACSSGAAGGNPYGYGYGTGGGGGYGYGYGFSLLRSIGPRFTRRT